MAVPSPSSTRLHSSRIVSTAGNEASTYLRSKVDAGRANFGDTDSGVAYFEWSADEDVDIDDAREWYRWMPALGRTTTEAFIRSVGGDAVRAERLILRAPSSDARTLLWARVAMHRQANAVRRTLSALDTPTPRLSGGDGVRGRGNHRTSRLPLQRLLCQHR